MSSAAHPRTQVRRDTTSLPARLVAPLTAAPTAIRRFGAPDRRDIPAGRRATHAALLTLLWFPALVLAVMSVIMLVRGLGYGFVIDDDGWVNAWGGPSLAGAWIVHALVGLFGTGVAMLGMLGLGAMIDRIDRRYLGAGGPVWPVPLTVVLAAIAVLFLIAWSSQI
ncbi:hypothetical protein IU433_02890 [Nocardia puris]|uniref:Uncharacterized protein n=1 Tax=Nocardia puris TaxID=208602 RepID=A0A366DVM3_9NOCA|nr:hypothetical protein [Nocardia puris]MBF6210100.1 hypothetical protein [Nocardia puris]MBF6368291.1 hypothetical protein [Nocardia puris]MBF6457990.1 hypothetical protein [Nocardia puris]RBO94151.1 hypothetical protein DFR74_102573 [Nocardia puris]